MEKLLSYLLFLVFVVLMLMSTLFDSAVAYKRDEWIFNQLFNSTTGRYIIIILFTVINLLFTNTNIYALKKELKNKSKKETIITMLILLLSTISILVVVAHLLGYLLLETTFIVVLLLFVIEVSILFASSNHNTADKQQQV